MIRILSRSGPDLLAAWLATPALVQETSDWSVYQDTAFVECRATSTPTSQENTRDGRPVQVSRGETHLLVFFRPDERVNGQLASTGGDPFADNSMVTLEAGSSHFTLLTQGEWTSPANPEEDTRFVDALRGGSEGMLTGQSGRGTVTQDTFSLQGLAPAVEKAERLCTS
jgi:hypothetical protein